MKKIPQDIFGNVAVLKFPRRSFWLVRKFLAWRFLKNHPSVNTVLEKVSGFSGKLRTHETRWLAGVRTKNVVYRENGCVFRFNVDEVYFSPRLSNERKLIAERVVRLAKKNSEILVMFAGVAPYSILIAKGLKRAGRPTGVPLGVASSGKEASDGAKVKVYSNELNRLANGFARKNVVANKVGDIVDFVDGDVRALPKKLKKRFDIIVMPRPNLGDTFLDVALKMSKKGTVVFYHGFGTREKVLDEIKHVCGKKVGKISIRKAGDIGRDSFRWLAEFKVL